MFAYKFLNNSKLTIMKKIISVIIFLIFMSMVSVQTCFSQVNGSISFNEVELDAEEEGESGIRIHLKISINNSQNMTSGFFINFFSKDKYSNTYNDFLASKIKDSKYSIDGVVAVKRKLTPRYQSSTWKDYKVFIPDSAIPHSKSNCDLAFAAILVDPEGEPIDHTNLYKFSYTYEDDNDDITPNNTTNHPHNHTAESSSNGFSCPLCNGLGFQMVPSFGGIYVRQMCGFCGGTGWININTYVTPSVPSTPPASSGSSSSGTNMQNVYQSSYNKTENLVRDTYNMYQREKSSSSPSYSTLSRIANDYRHYQESLRNTRNEAAKEGITISQSSWEYKSL